MKKIKISRILLVLAGLGFIIIGIRNRMANDFSRENNDFTSSLSADVTAKPEGQENIKEKKDQANREKIGQGNTNSQVDDSKGDIFIHITGAIKKDGLYKLKEGSRLDDLVKACGGLLPDADIKKINLSMILEDQMRIHILKVGENPPDEMDFTQPTTSSTQKSPGRAGKFNPSKKLNINKASLEELMELPGIGEKKAQAILEYREKEKFKSLEDLLEVSGIGEKMLEKIREQIVVD